MRVERPQCGATINGEPVEFLCEPRQSLLEVLRDRLRADRHQRGLQQRQLRRLQRDPGRPARQLLLRPGRRGGGTRASPRSRASRSPEGLHPLQQAFLEDAALQCGICTPGFIVAAKALLRTNPNPTEHEIRLWLAGNLCRCTGYDKIVRAVQTAADNGGTSMAVEASKYKVIGTRPVRPDGVDKVTGRAVYGADVQLPGMLHGRVLRSPHAHARIKSHRHAARRWRCPASKAVVTARICPTAATDRRELGEGDVNLRRTEQQLPGPRQGALPRPRRRRRRGHQPAHRRGGAPR